MKYHTILLLFLLGVCSCNDEAKNKPEEQAMDATREKLNNNYVDTLVLSKSTFSKQINCNGKLRAIAKSDLVMPTPGMLKSVLVHNGSLVKKGALLAVIDKENATIELEKAQQEMERTSIDLLDKLIGQGFDEDTTGVPAAILKRAKITSGYTAAQNQLNAALRGLSNCQLVAPFSGRVANVDSKLHQHAEKFCTLIDDSYFDVEFNILEAEMGIGIKGQRVIVTPFVNEQKQFIGTVTEVNPLIDDKGQIKIRAKIKNSGGYLMEGMNVRVVLESDIQDMYVVPKDAVVLRDGFHVMFRYEEGIAVWTYIDVLYANIDSYAITGNKVKQTAVNDKDVIITSGNLNLADGTAVIPNEPKQKQ